MSIEVRRLSKKDIPQAAKLVHGMWMQHVDQTPEILKKSYIASFDVESYLEKYQQDPNTAVFVAVSNSDIVGVARVEIKPAAEGMYNFDKVAYFDDLVVDSSHQHHGASIALTAARLDFVKSNKVKVCESRIYEYNIPAQAAALKNGFSPIYTSYYKFLD